MATENDGGGQSCRSSPSAPSRACPHICSMYSYAHEGALSSYPCHLARASTRYPLAPGQPPPRLFSGHLTCPAAASGGGHQGSVPVGRVTGTRSREIRPTAPNRLKAPFRPDTLGVRTRGTRQRIPPTPPSGYIQRPPGVARGEPSRDPGRPSPGHHRHWAAMGTHNAYETPHSRY